MKKLRLEVGPNSSRRAAEERLLASGWFQLPAARGLLAERLPGAEEATVLGITRVTGDPWASSRQLRDHPEEDACKWTLFRFPSNCKFIVF